MVRRSTLRSDPDLMAALGRASGLATENKQPLFQPLGFAGLVQVFGEKLGRQFAAPPAELPKARTISPPKQAQLRDRAGRLMRTNFGQNNLSDGSVKKSEKTCCQKTGLCLKVAAERTRWVPGQTGFAPEVHEPEQKNTTTKSEEPK